MAAPTKRIIPAKVVIRPLPAKAVDAGTALLSGTFAPVLALRPLPSRAVSFNNPTVSGNSGSNVLTEPVGHLIQHIKQYDPRLYEALQRMGTTQNNFQDQFDNLATQPQLFKRTIDIFDTTIANSVAPMQPVYGTVPNDMQVVVLVEGVLTNTIASDLTLRINNISNAGATTIEVGEFTIPAATAVGVIVNFTTFINAAMPYGSVLSWDIIASDGSTNKYGVASFSIWWEDQSLAS
jgi:hypothetical protein